MKKTNPFGTSLVNPEKEISHQNPLIVALALTIILVLFTAINLGQQKHTFGHFSNHKKSIVPEKRNRIPPISYCSLE